MGLPVPEIVAQQAQATTAANTDPTNPTTPNPFLHEIDLTDQELAEDDVPLPAYGEIYGEIRDEKNGTDTSASVNDDGRVNIRINHFNCRLSQIFTPALDQHIQDAQDSRPPAPAFIPPSLGSSGGVSPPPRLNIVIQVVGSRGDVQPFVALGKVLKDTYGHRVRLATHPTFKDFAQENGLEFFSIGGDPTRLMAFMVKNPGLRPGFRSVASGDVGQRRKDVAEYIQGCWRSCYQADDRTDDNPHEPIRNNRGTKPTAKHFVADCIIANPPSFAHIHCAEKLGIPLHIMFTMPYSPTQAFPHPLANIQSSNADPQLTNYISYAMIEILSWQVLGDIINRFRAKCLNLDPVSRIWGPGMLQRLKIPHTYCWSPALIPKPTDWGSHISISGFYFLNLASNYSPVPDLLAFLKSGPPPVYIGFGSIVLDNPNAMTELVFEAARKTGQRVLLSKGWGGMGADELRIPNGVFMLGNVPHDWLFKQVSCVVHHGGAGTTAAGLTAGRPTVVVPFFGDQLFWGAMVARAGAGPDPIPHKRLTADKLVDAINFCLRPESLERAKELASKIAAEQGCDMGAQSVHQFLEPDRLRCTLAPSRASVWRIKRTKVRLSAFAACTLANANLLDFQDLKLFRPQEHYIDEGPWDPISGGFTAFLGAVGGMMMGLADVPSETWRAVQIPVGRSRQQSQASLSKVASKSKASYIGKNSASLTSLGQSETTLNTENSLAHVQSPPNLSGRSTPTSMVGRTSVSGPSQGYMSPKQDDDSLSRSRSRHEFSPSKDPDMLRPTGVHMSKGAGRFVKAIVQGPVDISVNLTRGMHNIPKLWGDDTMRPQERVTDFRSGVKAVGREFGFGFYDGITGLVTQPWKGAREKGASGFIKGVGKGVGGFLVKPGAACLGILSHTMQGVNKEMQKLFGSDVQNYVIASRAAQGYEDWLQSSDAEKQDVIVRWKQIQKDLKKKGKPDKMEREARERQQKADLKVTKDRQNGEYTVRSAQSVNSADAEVQDLRNAALANGDSLSPLRTANAAPGMSSTAVEVTSREDEQEDADMKLAIQESLAMQATSAAEAHQRASIRGRDSNLDLYHEDDEEFDEELKRERREFEAISERAAAITGRMIDRQQPPAYDPGHLAGTLRSEFEAEQKGQQGAKTAEEKIEEEIVMVYIKKQSLLEVHHQNKGKGCGSSLEDEDDEDLQKTLKLSMQECADRYGKSSRT
ncbi:glycosyltransferase family 1 protein [Macroventuria anomochaeta]|uniref:Glycosyltransferase family 1 protein n=1 Tax=Macroventuria anomochaeta TaxID=301207 RepID=A0ACB6SFQ1_9PLEO|nr:glycosyltransferase family 1 protein [Macroventuria anomochaeta]KAF2633110.1 glycosyltransferase family 1 protein [Macroventuria anomochaeta]